MSDEEDEGVDVTLLSLSWVECHNNLLSYSITDTVENGNNNNGLNPYRDLD